MQSELIICVILYFISGIPSVGGDVPAVFVKLTLNQQPSIDDLHAICQLSSTKLIIKT